MVIMDMNSLIYYEFNNLDFYLNYFNELGVLDLITSRSFRCEIKKGLKKLPINYIIDFVNNYSVDFIGDVMIKDIFKNYAKYLFLYELLKKGE